jgi:hypothetical protein
LQREHRGIELSEVAPRPGSHYAQLNRLFRAELSSLWTPCDLQGALGPSQRSLAVSQHRQPAGISAQPSRGTQLRQRLGPFSGVIGRQTRDFPNRSNPTCLAARETGMRKGQLGILV